MRVIQDKQPDGTIHHMPEHDCPLGISPCAIVTKEGMCLDSMCDYLQSGNGDEAISGQKCTHPPCRGGG